MTLVSDQDNGLAYADTDDPAVHGYFAELAADVNAGLELCGFRADPHGVVARNPEWRMTRSQWRDAFETCLRRLGQRAPGAGGHQLRLPPRARRALHRPRPHRERPQGAALLALPERALGARHRDPHAARLPPAAHRPRGHQGERPHAHPEPGTLLRLRRRLHARRTPWSGSAPWRTRTCAAATRRRCCARRSPACRTLRLQQHAHAVRKGRRPSDAIDSSQLGPMGRAQLQEALRVVVAAQRKLPQRVML